MIDGNRNNVTFQKGHFTDLILKYTDWSVKYTSFNDKQFFVANPTLLLRLIPDISLKNKACLGDKI